MLDTIKLLRVHHWVKNLIIVFPTFFAGQLFKPHNLTTIAWAIIAFCFVSSFVYILNDIADVEKDRLHPTKKNRPLASGKITQNIGIVISVMCIALGFGISYFIGFKFQLILLIYVTINVAYSFWLKKVALFDVSIIAFGFVLRVLAGSIATSVAPSKWIIVLSFTVALFLAFSKRRDEILLNNEHETRKVLQKYTVEYLNYAILVLAAMSLVGYMMYTMDDDNALRIGNNYIYITLFPVLLGFLRWLQLIFVFKKVGSPVKILLNDTTLQVLIGIWLALFAILIYL